MSFQLDFLKFKNILNKNNIFLYDAQYRIAYYRYNKLLENIQQGGSSIPNQSGLYKPDKILKKIKSKNNTLLAHFINSLIFKDEKKIDYIINLI